MKQLLAADFSQETIENNPTNGNNYTLTINSIFSDNGLTPPTQQKIDEVFVEVTEELPALFIPCPRIGLKIMNSIWRRNFLINFEKIISIFQLCGFQQNGHLEVDLNILSFM